MREMNRKMICIDNVGSSESYLKLGEIYLISFEYRYNGVTSFVEVIGEDNRPHEVYARRFRELTTGELAIEIAKEAIARVETKKTAVELFLETFLEEYKNVKNIIRSGDYTIVILGTGEKGIAKKGENELGDYYAFATEMAYHRAMVKYYKNRINDSNAKASFESIV